MLDDALERGRLRMSRLVECSQASARYTGASDSTLPRGAHRSPLGLPPRKGLSFLLGLCFVTRWPPEGNSEFPFPCFLMFLFFGFVFSYSVASVWFRVLGSGSDRVEFLCLGTMRCGSCLSVLC